MSDVTLFSPVKLGALELAHRVVMAPLTRMRALQPGDVPGALNAEYYAQRATKGGLLISEASQVSQQGQGYPGTPGIYTDAQVAGWRLVTDAVHAKGGKIVLQLWHVGRTSHSSFHGGKLPVSASAIRPSGQTMTADWKMADTETPRALELAEIPGVVRDYVAATKHAIAAGFDGVELHSANGYLLDQFLREGTNLRTDQYGGSIENRARLLLEVVAAITEAIGADRVGIRLSPNAAANGIPVGDPAPIFTYVVDKLNSFGLTYLHLVEGLTGGPREVEGGMDLGQLRRLFQGPYLGNNGYSRELALEARKNNSADLIVFGKAFIANPDLVTRLRLDAPLNEVRKDLLYGGQGVEGYLDYPTLAQSA